MIDINDDSFVFFFLRLHHVNVSEQEIPNAVFHRFACFFCFPLDKRRRDENGIPLVCPRHAKKRGKLEFRLEHTPSRQLFPHAPHTAPQPPPLCASQREHRRAALS